jgi:aconitate hydratase
MRSDPFGVRGTFDTGSGKAGIYRLEALERQGLGHPGRLPYSIRVLLENVLRHCGERSTEDEVRALAGWRPKPPVQDLPFMPARVLLQDFTGVPALVDLAAMRDAMAAMGGDPQKINPLVPSDLVIDHSVQVDAFGTALAFRTNVELEYERNRERYALLRWAQRAFANSTVVPPGTGICHQVNLEYLARVVQLRPAPDGDGMEAFPDTLVGTDSHTTMVNGLGVLGWGVGGIEAEAVMLGEPYAMTIPEVVGFRLTGRLPEGSTATDLVLTVTEMLRQRGVVGKFVEFFGPGLRHLALPDRATIGNMAPEYGATCGFFPVDEQTLAYLRGTGRPEELVQLVERYCKEQGLFRSDAAPEPTYSDLLELDMGTVQPSLAGPKLPEARLALSEVRGSFEKAFRDKISRPLTGAGEGTGGGAGPAGRGGAAGGEAAGGGVAVAAPPAAAEGLEHGIVAIAAITSCTNTSNPSVMVAAGLLAKHAVERGLTVRPHVKTSMAPGSRVVTDYLAKAGLLPYLEALRFNVVGYGCTTCIGNSGLLLPEVAEAVERDGLVVAAVLSGNRNFEGRINAQVQANYLASPPLVVAYALAGSVNVDLARDPLGTDRDGRAVYLRDIWPSQEEIEATVASALDPAMFRKQYSQVFEGDATWRGLPVPEGRMFAWDPDSTYIRRPPYFEGMPAEPAPLPREIRGARVLAVLGDSITTDHISPAGSIAKSSPAGRYLQEHGVAPADFNTYGARRGNHEVLMRGTFANIRLRNRMVPDTEGGYTIHVGSGEKMTIYDAAMRYKQEGTPLLVLAGRNYGSGSSRDWAAKGPALQGVRAVIAETYERIHRSNLIGMGVLPLQFKPGESVATLGLTGFEAFDLAGVDVRAPATEVRVRARRQDGSEVAFTVLSRIDTPTEVDYFRHGGILPYVLRKLLHS